MTVSGFNPPLSAPVIGIEPDFLNGLPMDNTVGAIMALTAEVYMLRERLQTLEAELTQRKLLPEGAVENHQSTNEESARQQDDLAAFTHRVLAELSRDRTPVSKIHPDVFKYLQSYAQLRAAGKIK